MRPLALPLLSLAGIVLLLGVFGGSEQQERVLIRSGVSLDDNRSWTGETERMWRTPLVPSWAELLRRARERGWRGKTNGSLSGVRGHAGQKRLWDCFRAGRCSPAFHPKGPSRHLRRNIHRWGQWSQAIDVSRPGELVRIAASLGVTLRRPYPPEPWHVEALSVWTLPDIEKTRTVSEAGFGWSFAFSAFLLSLAAGVFWWGGGRGGGDWGDTGSGADPSAQPDSQPPSLR